MFYKLKKFIKVDNSCKNQKEKIDNMTKDISKIWSEKDEKNSTDVDGSYTGNPKDLGSPTQDADDL